MTFSDVLDLAEATFHQQREMEYAAKCNSLIIDMCLTTSEIKEHQNIDVGLYGVDIPIQAENLFHNTPIVAFRRDKSLIDILVHKKHNNLFF
uniref:Uncharacterized protein n=1 Tax=Magallana gigas TaxID=29159 RepID=K1Q590_MAGGI